MTNSHEPEDDRPDAMGVESLRDSGFETEPVDERYSHEQPTETFQSLNLKEPDDVHD